MIRIAYCVKCGPTKSDDRGCIRCHHTAWQRANRAKAASRGRCTTCATRYAEWPLKTCPTCLETAARSKRKREAKRGAA